MNTKSLINGVKYYFFRRVELNVLPVSHMFWSAIKVSLGRIKTFCRPESEKKKLRNESVTLPYFHACVNLAFDKKKNYVVIKCSFL